MTSSVLAMVAIVVAVQEAIGAAPWRKHPRTLEAEVKAALGK